jgi:hypothetical protein
MGKFEYSGLAVYVEDWEEEWINLKGDYNDDASRDDDNDEDADKHTLGWILDRAMDDGVTSYKWRGDGEKVFRLLDQEYLKTAELPCRGLIRVKISVEAEAPTDEEAERYLKKKYGWTKEAARLRKEARTIGSKQFSKPQFWCFSLGGPVAPADEAELIKINAILNILGAAEGAPYLHDPRLRSDFLAKWAKENPEVAAKLGLSVPGDDSAKNGA